MWLAGMGNKDHGNYRKDPGEEEKIEEPFSEQIFYGIKNSISHWN